MAPVIPEDVAFELNQVQGLTTLEDCRQLAAFAGLVPPGSVIVELGSHTGRSTVWLAWGGGLEVPVHACDPFPEPRPESEDDPFGLGRDGVKARFFENLRVAETLDVVTLHETTSLELATHWSLPVGLLFVDAIHEEVAVREDFAAWDRHLVAGGFVALHDYCDAYPGVRRVAEQDVLPGGYEALRVPTWPDSLWVAGKVAP